MVSDELAAWLRLSLTPGVGNATARKLLAAFGLAPNIFEQSASVLRQVVTERQAASVLAEPEGYSAQLERTRQWLSQSEQSARVCALGDAAYPAELLTMEDPPLLLYFLGGAGLTCDPRTSIAIVGSRNPTPQGSANARQFSRSLAQAGLTVVSGLALGVDAAAHEGALDAHAPGAHLLATIAVVGTGLDRVYPKEHRNLAHRIAKQGLLVSEYPLGTHPLAENFPRRNRLIAGLSHATLVVEAALKSGSLITARLACEQGKDVFAIPGSIHATQSRGCHALIKQGAKLIESAQDILEELQLPVVQAWETAAESGHATTGDVDEPPSEPLLEALGFDPVGLDALVARTGLSTGALQAALMALELDGRVARLAGGLFQRQALA